MGYDLNKFADVQDLPNHLRCLICNLVLADPLQSPCDHYFCNQCITIHLQSTNHCPHYEEDTLSVKSDKKKSPLRKMSFRKIIGKSPKDKFPSLKLSDLKPLPDTVLTELNALKVRCDFSLNGCKEPLTLADLNAHVKQCKFVDSKTEEQMSLENSEQQPASSIQQPTEAVVLTTTTGDLAEQSSSAADREIDQTRVESSESPNSDEAMDGQQSAEKRKDSESKSVNGEVKPVSEEEVGSDDFVVIPKAGGTSSTKSTESVQTNNSEPALLSSKENVNKEEEDGAEKKKKKKKKKKNANKTEADAVSLKDGDSGSHSELSAGGGSKAQSKESLVESEEVKRALREAETKSENLRTINSQLLGQIKKMKEERDEITKKLESQLGTDEADALKNKIQLLEKENKQQALKIIQLLDNNETMNQYIISLREEQSCLKAKYNATLNEVHQTLNRVKTCRQAN